MYKRVYFMWKRLKIQIVLKFFSFHTIPSQLAEKMALFFKFIIKVDKIIGVLSPYAKRDKYSFSISIATERVFFDVKWTTIFLTFASWNWDFYSNRWKLVGVGLYLLLKVALFFLFLLFFWYKYIFSLRKQYKKNIERKKN